MSEIQKLLMQRHATPQIYLSAMYTYLQYFYCDKLATVNFEAFTQVRAYLHIYESAEALRGAWRLLKTAENVNVFFSVPPRRKFLTRSTLFMLY